MEQISLIQSAPLSLVGQISIHLTDICNSACDFCVVASPYYKKDTVRIEDVFAFVRESADLGLGVANIHGGEPTISPHLPALLQHLRLHGFAEIIVQTNAVRLSDNTFLDKLISAGLSSLIVSVHGHTAELHDRQTQHKHGFARTLMGIENAIARGLRVQTNTVITSANKDNLGDIASLVTALGCSHLNFSNLHPVGSATMVLDRLLVSFDEVVPSLRTVIARLTSTGVTISVEGFPDCVVRSLSAQSIESLGRRVRMFMRGRVLDNYDDFMHSTQRSYHGVCAACGAKSICGGIYPEYLTRFGPGRFVRPFSPHVINAVD